MEAVQGKKKANKQTIKLSASVSDLNTKPHFCISLVQEVNRSAKRSLKYQPWVPPVHWVHLLACGGFSYSELN